MAPDDVPDLSQEELARVQTAIDAGTIWSTVDGGRFAMRLIDAKKCKLAPGVLQMWRRDDGLYEPTYSREVLHARAAQVIREAPAAVASALDASREVEFHKAYRDELIRLQTESIVSTPLLPWKRRRHRLAYLEKLNALRAKHGLRALTSDELRA